MPVLCFLLLGVFDLGRAFSDQEAVTNAARVGARLAQIQAQRTPPTIDDTAVSQAVINEVNGAISVTAGNITIARDTTCNYLPDGTPASQVVVTVSYAHTILFGLFDNLGNGGQLNLSASATMPYCAPSP